MNCSTLLQAVPLAVLFSATPLVLTTPAIADGCQHKSVLTPVNSLRASANIWDNWFGRRGSIQRESTALFEQALKRLDSVRPPSHSCPASCSLASTPSIVFHSAPTLYLDDYSDRRKCKEHLRTTSTTPLRYTEVIPKNVEAIVTWISELSQGKGESGRELYQYCDGSCSPQYNYHIRSSATSVEISADVICGHARDKSDNTYLISMQYQWDCIENGVHTAPTH